MMDVTISFTEEELNLIQDLSDRTGVTVVTLIKRAIAIYVALFAHRSAFFTGRIK